MELRSPSPTTVLGLVLVVVGAAYLAARLAGIDLSLVGWPAFVIVPGLAVFATAFVVGGAGGAGLATVGAVLTTTGLVLAVQRATGLWASWAYAWALVAPGSAGFGLLVYGLLTRQPAVARAGLGPLVAGLALFLLGLLFFEGVLGLSGRAFGGLDVVGAVALVVLGAALILARLGDRLKGRAGTLRRGPGGLTPPRGSGGAAGPTE